MKKVPFFDLILNAGQKHHVDPALIAALLQQESGFNPKARSPVGAIGIGQFMPATAKGMGVNPWDPASAIDGSARYLKNSLKTFGGNEKMALASYNAGAGAVKKYGGVPPYKETQHYVKAILANRGQFQPMFSGGQAQQASPMPTAPRMPLPQRPSVPLPHMQPLPMPEEKMAFSEPIRSMPTMRPSQVTMQAPPQKASLLSRLMGGLQQQPFMAPEPMPQQAYQPYSFSFAPLPQLPYYQTKALGGRPYA
jgi:hypothetical protein